MNKQNNKINTLRRTSLLLSFLIVSISSSAQQYNNLSESERIAMLEPPNGLIDVVIDSDTYNEIDDQYALIYALKSKEKLNIRAVFAAPFVNDRSKNAGEGMGKSYDEIIRLLRFMDISSRNLVYKGSCNFLTDATKPVESEAANHLVKLAKSYSSDNPLYVLALGAITNISSAILIDPSITEKIVVVWLGGNSMKWPSAMEYNSVQDLHATRIIFNSGIPFVQITVMPVVTHLSTTIPEMSYYLSGKGETAEYLLQIFKDYHPEKQVPGYAKILWDLGGVVWLVNPDWIPTEIMASPIVTKEGSYSFSPNRHMIRAAYYVDRNKIYNDFFTKIIDE